MSWLCKVFWCKWKPQYSHILQRPFIVCLHCGDEKELEELSKIYSLKKGN